MGRARSARPLMLFMLLFVLLMLLWSLMFGVAVVGGSDGVAVDVAGGGCVGADC